MRTIVVAVLLVGLAACSSGGGSVRADGAEPATPEAEGSRQGARSGFEELQDGCLDIVDSLPPPMESTFDGDLGALVAAGDLPAPPPYTGSPLVVTNVESMPDIDAYFDANPDVIAPEERREAFERLGYRGALDVDLGVGGVEYSVVLIRFESPAAATEYRDIHLRRVCSEANRLRPIDGVPGAVSYVRATEETKIPKAVFVIGDTEVNLSYCGCVASFDPVDSLTGWAQMIPQALDVTEVEPDLGT